MKLLYVLLAAAVTVSGFGFCTGSTSAQIAITEVSSSNALGEDWFELTNTSDSIVDLTGFYWDDDGPAGADGALFGNVSLAAGESLIVLEASEVSDGIATTFRNLFGLDASLQILTEDDFTGPDTFSGLSGNGDEISLFDTDPNVAGATFNLIDFVEFGAAPDDVDDPANFGASFDFTQLDALGAPTLSVSGLNGAFTATNGDVASPGVVAAAVPEPGSIALLTVLGALAGVKRRRTS